MSIKELISSSVPNEALVPFVVESLQNHFQEISLTVCYDEMIVDPDGTAYYTHEEADTDT